MERISILLEQDERRKEKQNADRIKEEGVNIKRSSNAVVLL